MAAEAFYSEHDPKAAAWLRELIAQGHIAPGVVDERDMQDVTPAELARYTQCHFFAGIGTWSYAARLAGWPDSRPLWTASLPCQPFSAAGGGAGFADDRHLWPAFFWLLRQCRPGAVFGEQVASRDGLAWLDHVSADLEAASYRVAALDLCAAGVGAPHIRQRLYWMADCEGAGSGTGLRHRAATRKRALAGDGSSAGGVADTDRRSAPRSAGAIHSQGGRAHREPAGRGAAGGLGDAQGERRQPGPPQRGIDGAGVEPGGGEPFQLAARNEDPCGLADAPGSGLRIFRRGGSAGARHTRPHAHLHYEGDRSGPTNGFWRDTDWLLCRDERWRPAEAGTFPLAHGVAGRVGLLRGYGNAIVAPLAASFIAACAAELGESRVSA